MSTALDWPGQGVPLNWTTVFCAVDVLLQWGPDDGLGTKDAEHRRACLHIARTDALNSDRR